MELHDQMLLVPMKVKALVTGNAAGAEYAGPTVNFGAFQRTENRIQAEPFTKYKGLEPGVHLHWFLPECLVHGIKEAQNSEITYPRLPDRWIVTRVEVRRAAYQDRKIICRTFQVDSSYISKKKNSYNTDSILVPTDQGNRFLGRSGEYGRLPQGGEYAQELTAAGYGEPGFYAYYPNCRNVFGFHDDMDGVAEESSLFYHVCGWYIRKEQDPVYDLCGEALADKLSEMGFAFSSSVPRKNALFWNPQGDGPALLLHGTCYGIMWKGKTAVYESGIPEEMPKIAIGNTSLEAFAALVANQTKRIEKKSERLLNVFLGDLMEEWADLDGVIKVEERIHKDTLQPLDGGVQWELKKREDADRAQGLLWQRLEKSLKELNDREIAIEKRKGILEKYQKDIYFAWFRYKANSRAEVKEQAAGQWCKLFEKILDIEQKLKLETSLAETEQRKLAKEAEAFYELTRVPAERFWAPCEPVLLFAGEGMHQEYGNTGGQGKSVQTIRTFAQIITSLPVPEDQTGKRVKADYLWSYVFLPVALPPPVKRLLGEALLLSPECVAITAYEAMLLRGGEATGRSYQEMREKIGKLLTAPWQTEKEGELKTGSQDTAAPDYEGILPDQTSMNIYYAPWNPLYMEWGISYMPDTSDSLENWELEEIDYRLKQVLPLAPSCKYRGRMILTPHMMQSLADTISNYREKHREQETDGLNRLYQELEQEFGKSEILSQRLSGFYTNFLTQRDVIRGNIQELWEEDPFIRNRMRELLSKADNARETLEGMDGAADTEPYISAVFAPLRMGSAQLKELRFIDSFGQVRQLAAEGEFERSQDLYISEQMDSSLYKNTMILTPRLLQPSRLSFQWVSGEEGVIFGWLVPNYIDSSLMVFDETGKIVGTFLEVEDQSGKGFIKCLSPSGKVINPQEVKCNLRLTEFMRCFGKRMAEKKERNFKALRHFVNFLSDELSGMNLPGMAFQKNIMYFIGRPLALADAEFEIETHTAPWGRQTWTGEETSENLLDHIKVALRLGDQRKRSDGLAGFFKKKNWKETNYDQFYTYGSNKDDQSYITYDNRVMLPINAPVRHTLLFDPSQAVHLISGMFPVRQVRLSESGALAAQDRLNMEMLINPVLSGADKLALPLAVLPEKRWSFYTEEQGLTYPAQSSQLAFAEEYPMTLLEGWLKLEKEGGK